MNIHYFWFSQKQAKVIQETSEMGLPIQRIPRKRFKNQVSFDGGKNWVTYTTRRQDVKTPSGKWDDYMYLGELPSALVDEFVRHVSLYEEI